MEYSQNCILAILLLPNTGLDRVGNILLPYKRFTYRYDSLIHETKQNPRELQTPVYINLFYINQKKLDILLKSPLVDTK